MSASTSVSAPTPAPAPPELAVLRAALQWARDMRIRVEPAAPPVECVSSHGTSRWVRRDPDAVVDPIGAAILRRQPPATHLADAAAAALFTPIPVAEGIADGLSGEPPSQSWMTSAATRTYGAGYLMGVELRTEMLTTTCTAHRLRFPKGENCSACLRGLS